MKHLVVFFFFLLPCSMGVAQSIFVEYEEIRSSHNIINHFDVWITDSISTMIANDNNERAHLNEVPFLKHKKKGFSYRIEPSSVDGVRYHVKDSLHNFKWELLPDTATILKRKCFSAKTTFRGREYKVFYAPEIPVSDGPWKLGGLPGLILEGKTTDGFISWRATKLDLAYKGSYTPQNISKHTYLDWKAYTESYKQDLDKKIYKIRSNQALKGQGAKIKYQVGSLEIFYPEVQINGLEIEID
ncbi:MAG: GLPGLI family protein [Bacteroidetes bacterium]|nr:MAG: GLPGLI family protein [Bacteroidota bacterium]